MNGGGRAVRRGTGLEWVIPHTFRKAVATLVSEHATSELAACQLGHSSSQVTRDFYVAKPPNAADVSELLQSLGEGDAEGVYD
jgi:integrase